MADVEIEIGDVNEDKDAKMLPVDYYDGRMDIMPHDWDGDEPPTLEEYEEFKRKKKGTKD